MQHPVQLFKARRTFDVRDMEDTFTFRPDRKWHWLQKLCFWILGKIGAYKIERTEKIERIQFTWSKLDQAIHDHSRAVWMELNHRPEVLIIGARQMDELFGMLPSYTVIDPIRGAPPRFAGLRMICLPYIDGFFVIPKL